MMILMAPSSLADASDAAAVGIQPEHVTESNVSAVRR